MIRAVVGVSTPGGVTVSACPGRAQECTSLVSLSYGLPGCSFFDQFCSILQISIFLSAALSSADPLGPATSVAAQAQYLMPTTSWWPLVICFRGFPNVRNNFPRGYGELITYHPNGSLYLGGTPGRQV